jgi:Tol biopolymer transport system component
MDANGENICRLTNKPGKYNIKPTWSPDGRKIAFASSRDGRADNIWDFDIYEMDADGRNVRKLTDHPGWHTLPAWSPNGREIAFTSANLGGSDEIYVIDADGENLRNLTNNSAEDKYPSWSPDGRRIAFASTRDVGDMHWAIYMMDADGGNIHKLTEPGEVYDMPDSSWAPDGRKITFSSSRDGNCEIYIMDADGQNVRRLTEHPADDWSPAWFDPAFEYSVSSAGKLATGWGWLKQNSK